MVLITVLPGCVIGERIRSNLEESMTGFMIGPKILRGNAETFYFEVPPEVLEAAGPEVEEVYKSLLRLGYETQAINHLFTDTDVGRAFSSLLLSVESDPSS